MTESENRPDREAWIIKLEYSLDPGKYERYADGSGIAQVHQSYTRVIHPAKCEKKILKNIGYETTLDNLIQPEINTGHRTMTGVIIADHIAGKVYLCKTALFLNHDLTYHKQMISGNLAIKPWWFGVPLITPEYLVPALSRPELSAYQVLEVGFIIEEKSSFGLIKQDPVVHIVESPEADEVMALFSRPASTVQTIMPKAGNPGLPPVTIVNQPQQASSPSPVPASSPVLTCPSCGTQHEKAGVKFCTQCGSKI